MRMIAVVGLLCLATACTSDAADTTDAATADGSEANTVDEAVDEAGDEAATAGTIIDDRTAVFEEGADVGGRARHTLDAEAVQAAIDTVETHDELAWARNHTRFLYGIEEPAATPAVLVVFACDQPPLTDTTQAIELLRAASDIDGGGECYGQARIALDGTLLTARTN